MMKRLQWAMCCIMLIAVATTAGAQVSGAGLKDLEKPYHPEANAQADLDSLLIIAQKEHKRIVIQAGGNWCIWCLRFHNFIQEETAIAELVHDRLLYYHLNYSKENKNEAVFNRYAPEGAKLGYPFFIVLDESGEVLAVRESGTLENGASYDKNKVLSFFREYIQ